MNYDIKIRKRFAIIFCCFLLFCSNFTTGETVFDILKDICEKNRIQISSRYTPLYNNYYVEGINQLYEFDCGKKSGWMYSVNGVFPNYGASSYKPKDGDKIEWVYTCNLGDDVGNHYEEK